MFNLKLDATPTYWWDVELLVPRADGSIATHPIEVLMARLSEDEADALDAEIAEQKLGDRAVARRLMRGFRKVAGEDGTELAYSEASRDALLSVPGVATAVVGNWYASRNQVHLGNLMRSRAAGQPLTAANKPGDSAPKP